MFAPRPGLRTNGTRQASVVEGQIANKSRSSETTVLGIDPGLTRCGYAVVQVEKQTEIKLLSLGVLRTAPAQGLPGRLAEIAEEIESLIEQYRPSAVAVEHIFFKENVKSAMSVAQVSGLVLSAAFRSGIDVVQYTPKQVKLAIAGWGSADKMQVQKMVKQRLKLNTLPKPADAADAAAIALCHVASMGLSTKIADAMANANQKGKS